MTDHVSACDRSTETAAWSYDFVHHRTKDGRAFRTLNILDEFGRECLAIRVQRKLSSIDVIDTLCDLFILRGVPDRKRTWIRYNDSDWADLRGDPRFEELFQVRI